MRRREFVTLLGGAAAWPLAARAPQLPVIGFLNGGSAETYTGRLAAFRRGLGETGYVEGRNVAIEFCWAEERYDRLPALAADLVRRGVAVIVAVPGIAALAAKAASTTIPIVFSAAGDPVPLGLVASLNRPGGNLTGAGSVNLKIASKRLELLHKVVPSATNITLLVNPTSFIAGTTSEDAHAAAAGALGLRLDVLHASTERDFDAVFANLSQLPAGALVIDGDPFFTSRIEQLAALALRHAMPAVYQAREFVTAGGLMIYGAGILDCPLLAGVYTGLILKGEKPADLVQRSTNFEYVINLKTAKAFGLDVPPTLLTIADEVIE